jgi:hypothetical protein
VQAEPNRQASQVLTKQQFIVVALVLVAVVAFNVSFVSGMAGGPERHAQGDGPLGSLGGVGLAFDPDVGGPSWTVGIQLCLAQGNQPAVLDGSVGPTSIVGDNPPPAVRFVGAYVREFTPSQVDTPIGSIGGFPPILPDKLHQVKGFEVTDVCPQSSDPSRPYTELLIGVMADPANTGGGGWHGVDVGYASGWRHHVVSLKYDIMICGPNAPGYECPD